MIIEGNKPFPTIRDIKKPSLDFIMRIKGWKLFALFIVHERNNLDLIKLSLIIAFSHLTDGLLFSYPPFFTL